MGRVDHHHQGDDADPLQADHDRQRRRAFRSVAFILASIVSRSLRFFLVAALLWYFGDAARQFIERRLTLVTTVFAVALVGGFVVLRYL